MAKISEILNGSVAKTVQILNSLENGVRILKETLKTMPSDPGVYRMINTLGDAVYVGKAKNLKKRVISYTQIDKLPIRLQRMVAEIDHLVIVTTKTEVEALLLESNLIKKLKPRYNILLKDDKSYPYIFFPESHDFSKALKHRGSRAQKGDYFGPFANVGAVDEVLLSLQRIFMIRNCSDTSFKNRKRPCLQYYIKRCSAPCVEKITKADYAQSIDQAKNFLRGKTTVVQDFFAEKMQTESDLLNYEAAAIYRDQIKMMTELQEKQRIHVQGVESADIIALYQEGGQTVVQIFFFRYGRNYGTESIFLSHTKEQSDAQCMAAFLNLFYENREPSPLILLSHAPEDFDLIKESLSIKGVSKIEIPKLGVKKDLVMHAMTNATESLQRKSLETQSLKKVFSEIQGLFGLAHIPERIEIYDNSHFQGSNPVGVMVLATLEGFKSYRKYKFKFGRDDFAMMAEMLERRFKEETNFPDLLLIDGGKGQVSSVQKVLDKLNLSIPVVGIAKGEDRNAGHEYFVIKGKDPFQLDFKSPTLYFLQKIRDEAHRFAITTHRKQKIKDISKSTLDDLPGIGPKRKKAMLQYFGSLEAIKKAGVEDLILVKGINQPLAKAIYDFFKHE